MKNLSKTIVFFGSGPIAARSLQLLQDNFKIEAVITKPQPSHHKELPPVLAVANKFTLPTLTISSQAEQSALFDRYPFSSDTGLVIDHGILIARDIIDRFAYGIINSHFSLLPRWRGADPISFAILSGEHETGVSLMVINDKLDEGDLLAQQSILLPKTVTSPQLTDQLIGISHQLLVDTLPRYWSGSIRPFPQNHTKPSYSRKLTKADGTIDWHKPAQILEREVRAFLNWPRSRTSLRGIDIIITAAHVKKGNGVAGQLCRFNHDLGVYCAKDILIIDRLIPAGKKEMPAQAFINGYHIIP
jgi:methionyl-tRNA formyltransferase